MTTVIRVRRKRTTDALENLVLPLKRAKVDKPSETTGNQAANAPKPHDDNKAVFTFAGTVERKSQPISIHIQSALRRAAIGLTPKKPTKPSQQSVKSKTESTRTGAREKARTSHTTSSKNRRLKVIDSSRGLKLHELDKDSQKYQSTTRKPALSNGGTRRPGSAEKEAERIFALFDVIQDVAEKKSTTTTKSKTTVSKSKKSGSEDISCNSVKMTREKVTIGEDMVEESEYVYDLYYTDCAEFDFGENSIGMRSEKDEVVYEYFADDPPHDDDDDDENDESNWRNDYPDDEDEHKPDRDMFDELVDDYRYASSDDEDLVGQYSKLKLGSRGVEQNSDSDIDDYDL